jgi:hypothetical protein
MPSKSSGILLAHGWPISKVRHCLRTSSKAELIAFLRARYRDRFFKPIQLLRKAPSSDQGYGFAMMALCSLLVESIQCCRDGLPSTNKDELQKLGKYSPPITYAVPESERKNGRLAFQKFFADFQSLFPNLDGSDFYRDIRNGLLHQAQTKNGWKIRTDSAELCDPKNKVINRDLFEKRLRAAFDNYLTELSRSPSDSCVWMKAKRKIWWLIRMSV